MNLHAVDLTLIFGYLAFVAVMGFWIQRRATRHLDAYYLAGRNVPWWMLGLAGCSSYIDIGGTMAMVGALYYLGLKAIWVTHIYWGWFMICFYMAFQAKWIRRSGVMTFAEWNRTRFGDNRDAELARLAAALFLLVLMLFNLTYIAVGIGKFAEAFLPLPRWGATLLVFAAVGIYVTLAGFFGVILTDMLQTLLIAVGAVILTVILFTSPPVDLLAGREAGWGSLTPAWQLWSAYPGSVPESYGHFHLFGPLLVAGFTWAFFRILAGPNVWDFQFFLTARSPRDAALAGGMWTVGYTLRWILGCAFLLLGISFLGSRAGFDAEKIMPLVLLDLPVGVRGLFLAVLLAALMSTLDAMINVTSSVVVNDFLKRYLLGKLAERQLVRLGQLASVGALLIGFAASMLFEDIISAWETMIFVVVTMILVPATCRWHWWRFSARAFVWSMVASAGLILARKVLLFPGWPASWALLADTLACLAATLLIGFLHRPTDREVLVDFYARIRPFGFWGPIRRLAEARGLVPLRDPMPRLDALNGLLTAAFQLSLALLPFYLFLRLWDRAALWGAVLLALSLVLYFTWYRTLPSREEG